MIKTTIYYLFLIRVFFSSFLFLYGLHPILTSTRTLTFINRRKFIFINYRSCLHFIFSYLVYIYIYNTDQILIKSSTHIDAYPPLSDKEKESVYLCNTSFIISHIRSAIHLFNYLSSESVSVRCMCVPINASICK